VTSECRPLSGKAAIITGSARNMGRAFAVALARLGADITVHCHRPEATADAEGTVRQIRGQGARATLVCGDLVDLKVVKELFDATETAFGRVDIVINNAGLVIKKPFMEIDESEFDRSFGINAKAAFFVMQEAAHRIADHGRIISMGTTILGATIPLYSVYAGAKAALEDFTRALAKEIGSRGVTVNVVAPGPIDTEFYRSAETPESMARAATASIAGRLGHVDDVVPLIEFLASPQSQWITAQTLFINGGYLAR